MALPMTKLRLCRRRIDASANHGDTLGLHSHDPCHLEAESDADIGVLPASGTAWTDTIGVKQTPSHAAEHHEAVTRKTSAQSVNTVTISSDATVTDAAEVQCKATEAMTSADQVAAAAAGTAAMAAASLPSVPGPAEAAAETALGKAKAGVPVMLMLSGPPGSGKSTFCERLIADSQVAWVRVNQDSINRGEPLLLYFWNHIDRRCGVEV